MMKPGYIHDPIHGHIELTELEMAVVDSLEFQRLRFIRQNSLLHYVFPGAFHTRFAHSLGACHIGGEIAEQIIDWVNEPEIYYPLQVFRLACLLHDVGHGAFSHSLSGVKIQGEGFLPTLNQMLENSQDWHLQEPGNDVVTAGILKEFSDHLDQPVEHEVLSILLIRKIFIALENEDFLKDSGWEAIPRKAWVQDITAMLLPSIPCSQFFKDESWDLLLGAYRSFPQLDEVEADINELGRDFSGLLAQLVSGTIDADRMDYLIRDSRNCGVNYGMYDKEGIISALKLIFEKGHLRVALNAKRINTVDDFLWSRYQMFKQVYCHKTHSAYNLLLERAMEDLIAEGSLTRPKTLVEFEQLTDDLIMSQVIQETQKNPRRKDWMGAFARRELPKLITVVEASFNDPLWEKEPLDLLKNQLPTATDIEPSSLAWISLKAEVVKGDVCSLPAIFYFNKQELRYERESFLARSVFFESKVSEEDRVHELKDRLNRKLMFFFRL